MSDINPFDEHISCLKCKYISYPSFKHMEYDFRAENSFPVFAEIWPGWCNTCDRAVMIESVPVLASMEKELEILEGQFGCVEKNQEVRNQLEEEYGDFDELLYPDRPYELYPRLNEADNLWAKIQWRKKRRAPSRCLECNNHDIILGSDSLTAPLHPSCGGQLSLYIRILGEKPMYKYQLVSVEGLTNA